MTMADATVPPIDLVFEDVERAARAWGVRDDQPEGAFLLRLIYLSRRLDERVEACSQTMMAAQSVTPEQLQQAMMMAARQALRTVGAAVAQKTRWHRWAMVVAAGAALACAGFVAGFQTGGTIEAHRIAWSATELQQAFQSGADGAHWMAIVAASNDLSQPARWCSDPVHLTAYQGGVACTVSLWIKPPPPPVRR
jgi:hypothetical protein